MSTEWKIYTTNDNCPDYTWGYTEEQVRQSFADIVRGHLDEMKRTNHCEPYHPTLPGCPTGQDTDLLWQLKHNCDSHSIEISLLTGRSWL